MIVLRKMHAEEFPGYTAYFIADYGQEIARNFGCSLQEGEQKAKRELAEDLPLGVDSPGHCLMCIDLRQSGLTTVVGYLWYANQENETTAFIFDFYVFERYRGGGYGTAAITELEKISNEAGLKQIKLRVAYYNQRALKFYKAVGFGITGYNMARSLTDAEK